MGAVTADGNNHISAMSYDASGNAQSDGVSSYTWDGESQMKTAGGVTYAYDGDGRRRGQSSPPALHRPPPARAPALGCRCSKMPSGHSTPSNGRAKIAEVKSRKSNCRSLGPHSAI